MTFSEIEEIFLSFKSIIFTAFAREFPTYIGSVRIILI